MTTYHQEKVQTAIAKIAECLARDPKRAERLLGDVKKWSAEAEREAYARGKADAAPQASAEESAVDKPIPDSVEHYGLIDERVGAPATDAGRTDVRRAQPKRRPYNASASLSEYGIFPECDAAEDSAKGAGDVDERNFSDLIDAYTDAVRNGKFSERVAARAELMNSYRQQRGGDVATAGFLENVRELADHLMGCNPSRPQMREAARLLQEFYLDQRAAISAQQSQGAATANDGEA